MNIEEISIAELSEDPGNVRKHSSRNLEAVKASLRRFGQQLPLVIDGDNVVRVGNCRLAAMRALGWETAKVVRTDLNGADLAAYSVADNRTGDPEVGSTFDQAGLAGVLSALAAEDESLATATGYTLDEIASLCGGESVGALEVPVEFPEYGEDIETNCKCPKCGFEWQASK